VIDAFALLRNYSGGRVFLTKLGMKCITALAMQNIK
jgi:hypothetical protein